MRLQINYTNVGHVIPLVSGPHCFTKMYEMYPRNSLSETADAYYHFITSFSAAE